jgi:hypothetical protein
VSARHQREVGLATEHLARRVPATIRGFGPVVGDFTRTREPARDLPRRDLWTRRNTSTRISALL